MSKENERLLAEALAREDRVQAVGGKLYDNLASHFAAGGGQFDVEQFIPQIFSQAEAFVAHCESREKEIRDAASRGDTRSAASPDNSWQRVSIDGLESHGVDPETIDALRKEGLLTLGAVANYAANKPLREISGIGPAREASLGTAVDAVRDKFKNPSP